MEIIEPFTRDKVEIMRRKSPEQQKTCRTSRVSGGDLRVMKRNADVKGFYKILNLRRKSFFLYCISVMWCDIICAYKCEFFIKVL